MKNFIAVFAATCIATVRAHTMLVCSATSCNTPGRVTLFLGTYAHSNFDPSNSFAPASPGEIKITTMGGVDYDFKFSKTCQALPGLMGSDGFTKIENSLKASVSEMSAATQSSQTNTCRQQMVTNKPIIDDDSIISCYNHDTKGLDPQAAQPRSVMYEGKRIFTVAEWKQENSVFCGYENSEVAGFYYMTMDNVLPGDYRIKGWTTDYTLASGTDFDTKHHYGIGVCGVVGYASTPSVALANSNEYAFSLSVATNTCDASVKCDAVPPISGIVPNSISDCNGGVSAGYMCDARCKSGYTQVGSLMCQDDGKWGGFECVPTTSTNEPCSIDSVKNSVPGAAGVEYDSAAMCGYMSKHNAECTVACADGMVLVQTTPLKCENGKWSNPNNEIECKEMVDVVLAPPPGTTVTSRDSVSLNVNFETATECSTGKYCSKAVQYRIRLTISDPATGSVIEKDCPDYNNGIAPSNGIVCYLPTGETLGNKKYGISVFARNRAGWSGPSNIAEFWPKWPRDDNLDKSVLCHVYDNDDVNAVGPHMRDGVDVFGKDWIKYYSSATDYNGQPTRLEATSASTCCEACYDTEGCDYWTYVKNSTACYIKHQDNRTVYIDTENPTRISGINSPHSYNFELHQNDGWHPSINFKPNWEGKSKRRLSTSDSLDTSTSAPVRYLMGIDFMGADWVKFSNRRPETDSPESCEEACENDPHCCYWTWSPIDPDEACYLKSTVPMTSRVFGYGQKVFNFGAVSGYSNNVRDSSRCENQSQVTHINASTPVVYPVGIFRRHFDRFAETALHKFFPTRPSLYMIGSGITEEYINALPKGVGCSNEMDLANPCFTEDELLLLRDQFQAEKALVCGWSSNEADDYYYFGGRQLSFSC